MSRLMKTAKQYPMGLTGDYYDDDITDEQLQQVVDAISMNELHKAAVQACKSAAWSMWMAAFRSHYEYMDGNNTPCTTDRDTQLAMLEKIVVSGVPYAITELVSLIAEHLRIYTSWPADRVNKVVRMLTGYDNAGQYAYDEGMDEAMRDVVKRLDDLNVEIDKYNTEVTAEQLAQVAEALDIAKLENAAGDDYNSAVDCCDFTGTDYDTCLDELHDYIMDIDDDNNVYIYIDEVAERIGLSLSQLRNYEKQILQIATGYDNVQDYIYEVGYEHASTNTDAMLEQIADDNAEAAREVDEDADAEEQMRRDSYHW